MTSYKHLNKEERDRLAVLRSKGWTLREIGEKLGRHYSVLSRELKRNGPRGQYLPHKAQERAQVRRHTAHKRKRLKTYALRHDIEALLMGGWSPELAAGWLNRKSGGKVISHESIYRWIYGEAPHLAQYLVRRHKKRFPKRHGKSRQLRIPSRVSIAERPLEINARSEAGHWEDDLMVSSRSAAALQVCVERVARLTRIKRIANKSAGASREATEAMLKAYPAKLRKSITYDNGLENIEHWKVNAALGTKSYFCEPYHSWEKGTVENTNGLIRRFLPKGTDFAKISDEQVERIEAWLNNRPRKCLGYRTPAEVFSAFVALAG